ncbi:cytochrome P450 [Cytidiella melzeri]|nr:cytochrome P450 [Cytidiella melzeri]
MAHPYSRYRLRLFWDFVRILLTPSILFVAIIHYNGVSLPWTTPPAYILWLFAVGLTRVKITGYFQARAARRAGGRLPTEVVGKWPGNVDVLIKLGKAAKSRYPAAFFRDLFDEYQCTTLNLKLLWSDLIITMDEQHMKTVLSTGFNHFWRGRRQKERMEKFLGDGIFNRDDEDWKKHRALARPFFAKDRTSDFDVFEKYAQKTVAIISNASRTGQAIEAQDLFARFTADSAGEFLFGHRFDTLDGTLPVAGQTSMSTKGTATNDEFGTFTQSFEAMQEIVAQRARRGYFWPVFELFKDDMDPHVKATTDFLNPIVDSALRNARKMKEAGVRSSTEHSTFLHYLADNTEDPKVIRDQLLNVLLASRDTTACLLTFLTYAMAMYPDVARKMREEVLQHCGQTGVPTFETVKSMRYVHAVINETLRLFPPVPINVREVRESGVVFPPSDGTYTEPDPTPIYVPEKTVLMYFPLLIQHNTALWGDDAYKFDPDRWLDERLTRFTEKPMVFTPFSGGPRICLGQNYARNEATFLIVRLLQEFDTFTLAPEAHPAGSLPPPQWQHGTGREPVEKICPQYAMTLFVKGGLWVRFGKANES